jgi:rhamnose transport system permease protein
MSTLRTMFGRWEGFLALALVLTLVLGAANSKYFLAASNLSIAVAGLMPVAIVALPMTLIIVCGEIDISVGSMVGLCAAVLAVCREQGLSIEVSMLASVGIGVLGGALNGAIIAFIGLPSLVVTIGTLALDRGIAQIILKERGVTGFPDWYQEIGFGTIGETSVPWSSLIFLAFFAVFAAFLHATYRGRALFAIGNNREAARFSGVDVRLTIFGVFVTCGAMCSVASVVLTSYLASARSDTAVGLELPVITAVVLGGVDVFGGSGTLGGVLVALALLAFVQNALGLAGVTPEEQQIVTGLVLISTLVAFGAAKALRDNAARRRRGAAGKL